MTHEADPRPEQPVVRCFVCWTADDDLRLGVCFNCASKGEERAAKRTVMQHIAKACRNMRAGNWENARCDLRWAWERLTKTGDYATGGTFDFEGYDWR